MTLGAILRVIVYASVVGIVSTGCASKSETSPPTKPTATAGVAHYPPGMKLGSDGKPVSRGQ